MKVKSTLLTLIVLTVGGCILHQLNAMKYDFYILAGIIIIIIFGAENYSSNLNSTTGNTGKGKR